MNCTQSPEISAFQAPFPQFSGEETVKRRNAGDAERGHRKSGFKPAERFCTRHARNYCAALFTTPHLRASYFHET